jgi:hypothetical protein
MDAQKKGYKMLELEKSQSWMGSLLELLPITQQFVLYGNIYDFYSCYDEKYGYLTYGLGEYIAEHFSQQKYQNIFVFKPMEGFELLKGDQYGFKQYGFGLDESNKLEVKTLQEAYIIIKKLFSAKNEANAIVFDMASYIKKLPSYQDEYEELMFALFKDSFVLNPINTNETSLFHQIIFLVEEKNDVPQWYRNTRIKHIKIPNPDIKTRKVIIDSVVVHFENYKDSSRKMREQTVEQLAISTEGMLAKEILSFLLLAKKQKRKNLIDFMLEKKLNASHNPWSRIDPQFLNQLEETISERISIGNKGALQRISQEIKNGYLNFSNLEMESFLTKPRSVFLFTGHHQDEQLKLAVLLAELLFESKDRCCMINMSDFSYASDLEKFLDKKNSALLSFLESFHYGIIVFNELQKADHGVVQAILQIIKEGKLTIDGVTHYFHGYIIILTFGGLTQTISLKDFFISLDADEAFIQLQKNTINFELLDTKEATVYINKSLDIMLDRIRLLQKVTIVMRDEVISAIVSECLNDQEEHYCVDLKNRLHEAFVLPLTNLFFEMQIKENDLIVVKNLDSGNFQGEFA